MNHDTTEQRHARLERLPDPGGEILAGRIFQPRHFIEVAMIQCLEDRRERLLDLGKVHHPAQLRIDRSRYVDFDTKRVSMQARTLMSGWDLGQAVRRFDLENLEQIHGHRYRDCTGQCSRKNKMVARGGIEPPTSAL